MYKLFPNLFLKPDRYNEIIYIEIENSVLRISRQPSIIIDFKRKKKTECSSAFRGWFRYIYLREIN